MKVSVYCVGGVKGALAEVVGEYEARAARYWRLSVEEVEAGIRKSPRADPQAVRAAEAIRLRGRLHERAEVVALTRTGMAMGSRDLAGFLEDRALRSVHEVSFLIGGAFGLGPEILEAAHARITLSALTLPHELARLLLAEQLYRAGTISKNEPYHKGP